MSRTLLLNASYEPLGVVPLRRAIVLVMRDKAEVLEENGLTIRSERLAFQAPTVIRLARYVHVPFRGRVPLSRRAVSARDGGLCQYCGRKGNTLDHVIPRSRGGRHAWDNVVLACERCNHKKSDKYLADLGWRLPVAPKTPNVEDGLRLLVGSIHDDWVPYLGLEELTSRDVDMLEATSTPGMLSGNTGSSGFGAGGLMAGPGATLAPGIAS